MNDISKIIINLKSKDLELRDQLIKEERLGKGYNAEMEKQHIANAKVLDRIIETIGYPTYDKVGQEASEAAWLIIQHAISWPQFMKKCVVLLEKEVKENKAYSIQLAYLTDRIAVFEGREQLYATSFDWDDEGRLMPCPYDSEEQVNKRRKELGLNSLEEQLQIIRQQAYKEKQLPPENIEERKRAYDAWRKKVGWI